MPAWCDRILFKSKRLNLLTYKDIKDVNLSDHKPVQARFLMRCRDFVRTRLDTFLANKNGQIKRFLNELKPLVEINTKEIVFPQVYYGVRAKRKIELFNKGKSPAVVAVKILTFPPLASASWIHTKVKELNLPLRKKEVIEVGFKVDKMVTPWLEIEMENKNPILEGEIVFDVKDGDSLRVKIKGEYMRSCLGCSLEYLCTVFC